MEKFKEKQKFQLGKVIYVKSKFNIKQRRKGLSFKKGNSGLFLRIKENL